MMGKSNLYIMVGIPGSGKSTFLKHNTDKGDIIVSRDEIRFSMLKETDDYFANEKAVWKEFIRQINMGLGYGRNVYVDATNISRRSRAKILNALTIKPNRIIAIYIKVPIERAIIQNNYRTGRALVPTEAIFNMAKRFEEPTRDEGFDNVYVIGEWTSYDISDKWPPFRS